MSRLQSKGGAIRIVVLTVLVVLSVVTAAETSALTNQSTPMEESTNGASYLAQSNGTASNTIAPRWEGGWNMARANAAHTNYINTTGPTNPITVRWQFSSEANGFTAGPIVTNGTVYFGTDDGILYAVDAWTGEVQWNYTFSSNYNSPKAIAVLRNTVYVSGENTDKVYALDAATGEEFWSFPVIREANALKVVNRTLYVMDDKRVYALGALRGEPKWKFRTPEKEHSRPTGLAVKDNTVYVPSKGGHVFALDAQTGSIMWHTDIVEDVNIENEDDKNWLKSVVVANGLVYVTNLVTAKKHSDSNFYALDAETGEARWTRTAPRADDFSETVANGFSTPSVRGDTVYFTGKYLHAVKASTGEDRWSQRSLRGSPALLDDIGYIRKGGPDGALYTLDPDTGVHHARFTPPQFNNRGDGFASPIAVLNGSLYTGVGLDARDSGHSSPERTIFYTLGTPEFTYRNLSVTPQSPDPGEAVTVTATVANTGTGPGQFKATFTIDGEAVNSTGGRLVAGASRTVTFTYVFENAGAYTVGIGGQTRNIGVGDATPAPTPTPTPTSTETAIATATGEPPTVTTTATSTPGFGVGALLVAIAVLALFVGSRK